MGVRPLGETRYHDHINKIVDASDKAKEEMLDQAVETVRKAYTSSNVAQEDDDGKLDISVTYDGSWQKRGHTSKHGIGGVIDALTGLVIDYEALSLYCQLCAATGKRLKKDDAEQYDAWYKEHQKNCTINHMGSSGAMEVKAASTMWQRSIQRNNLRYTTLISDGDCKTFLELQRLQPYGQRAIQKEECINHFAKRLGTVRKDVQTEKARNNQLGIGKKGNLTNNKIDAFQTYFQRAVLDNKGSVEQMKKAAWATFLHTTSTDENPQHQNCPTGVDSWCKHQKALTQNLPPPKHTTSVQLNERVASYIKRLRAPDIRRTPGQMSARHDTKCQ